MLSLTDCILRRFTTFRRYSVAVSYEIFKGSLKHVRGNAYSVYSDDTPEPIVSASIHPRGAGVLVPNGSTVFVSRPMASDPEMDRYEVIAFAYMGPDGKLLSSKYSCIHPEREVEKRCKNCPSREDPQ